MVRRMGPNGAVLVLVQDMFGLCSVPSGTEVAGQLQARKTRKSTGNVENNSQVRKRKGTGQEAQ